MEMEKEREQGESKASNTSHRREGRKNGTTAGSELARRRKRVGDEEDVRG
jgi:hypothetical protein